MHVRNRLDDIMAFLERKRQASNSELCALLHCSTSTLRRDLLILENEGLVKRVHGGVFITGTINIEPAHVYRESENIQKKRAIAEISRDFIGSGMCLFLDSSSTVLQICYLLNDIHNLIVLTNGLKTGLELAQANNDSLKVYMTGGEIKHNSSSVIGTNFFEDIKSFNINLAICSCAGIDQKGVYEASLSQALAKKKLMEQADKMILLVDDSKFNTNHFFRISELQDYEAIITNQEPPNEYLTLAEENEIEFLW